MTIRHTAYLLAPLGPLKISASPHHLDNPDPSGEIATWAYDVFNTEKGMRKSTLRWDGPKEDAEAIEKHLTSLLELDISLMGAIARTLRQIEGSAADVKKDDTAESLKQSLASIRMRVAEVAEAIEKHEAK